MRRNLNEPKPPGRRGIAMSDQSAALPTTIEPVGLSTSEAARLVGISESHFYAMKKDGRLGPEPRRLGDSVRWDRRELLDWWNAGCPARHRWQAIRQGGGR